MMQYVIKWESKAGRSGYTTRVFDNYTLAIITAEKLNNMAHNLFHYQSFIMTHTVVELTNEIREEME